MNESLIQASPTPDALPPFSGMLNVSEANLLQSGDWLQPKITHRRR